MNPRKLSCICLLLFINIALAQELPVIVPPSPTAFQLTRFGDVAVNESTGKISPSIPLYTYTAGRLQLPISLSYQGNGVKVDQAASWTGINWNLNAGGVITRIVKDEDDFFSYSSVSSLNNRKFYTHEDINQMDFYNGTTDVDKIKVHVNHDSEADIFNFSFLNYSGGFYLDENFVPRLTKYDNELKIIIGQPPIENGIPQHFKREIIIITPDGTKYYFGGISASEKSKTTYPTAGGGALQFSQTAFYLHKIEHPLGDEINFVYSSKEYTINSAISTVKTKLTSVVGGCVNNGDGSGMPDKVGILSNTIEGGKFLSKIYSNKNDYEVVFSSVDRPNATVAPHYTKILDSLSVRNKTNYNDVISTVNLQYLYPKGISSSQRFFLEKVILHDGTFYKMDYNSPEHLPERFDYDQDLLGYYNNKNNVLFLPKTERPEFAAEYNYLADKTSDFYYASKGALIKLTYPTGGYTVFDYESGILGPDIYESETKYAHFLTYRNNPFRNPENDYPNSISIGVPELVDGSSSAVVQDYIVNQKVDVRLSNVISTEHLDQHVIFKLSVLDLTTNTELFSTPLQKTYQFGSETEITDPYLGTVYSYQPYIFKNISLIANHSYQFTLDIVANSFQSDATIDANIDFNYKIKSNELAQDYGIRIKEVKNYTQINNSEYKLANRKLYEYLSSNKFIAPNFVNISVVPKDCGGSSPNGGGFVYSDWYYINLNASSINSIYSNSNNEKVYDKVRIYNLDSLSVNNGYTEKEFLIVSDPGSFNQLPGLTLQYLIGESVDYYSDSKENKSVVNGTLKKEVVYERNKNKSHSYRKVAEYENYYDIDLSTSITNNDCKIVYNSLIQYGDYRDLNSIYLGTYNTYSNKILLTTSISKIFDYSKIVVLDTDNDGIPDDEDDDANGNGINDDLEDPDNDGYPNFADHDDDGNGILDEDEIPESQLPEVLETITNYEYNQYPGQISKESISTSIDNQTIETMYQYPSTSTNISTYISKPLFVRTFKNLDGQQEQISSVFTEYKNLFNSYSGLKQLPSKIITVKGGDYLGSSLPEDFVPIINFQDRITYHDYDNYGNPIEVSKTNGMHIVYLWGYNGQYPIAKIENATYSEVSNQILTNVQNLSNLDDDTCLDSENCDEKELRTELTELRNSLPNAMVTTYTYDPLIGVTSVTDPKGYTTYYEYDDEFNRLKQVKDAKGNILTKYDYNYKQ